MRATVLLASEVGWYERPHVGAKAIGRTVFDHPVETIGLVLVVHLDGTDMNRLYRLFDLDRATSVGAPSLRGLVAA